MYHELSAGRTHGDSKKYSSRPLALNIVDRPTIDLVVNIFTGFFSIPIGIVLVNIAGKMIGSKNGSFLATVIVFSALLFVFALAAFMVGQVLINWGTYRRNYRLLLLFGVSVMSMLGSTLYMSASTPIGLNISGSPTFPYSGSPEFRNALGAFFLALLFITVFVLRRNANDDSFKVVMACYICYVVIYALLAMWGEWLPFAFIMLIILIAVIILGYVWGAHKAHRTN